MDAKRPKELSEVCGDEMKQDDRQSTIILCVIGIVPVIWLALLVAPSVSGGLLEILERFTAAMNNPLQVEWCEDSLKTVLIFLAVYGMGTSVYFSTRKNYRRREEHGSAKWGNAKAVDKK